MMKNNPDSTTSGNTAGFSPTWSDLDIELYHDGQLEPDRAQELGEALRHDLHLRQRLARIVRADALVRDSLLTVTDSSGEEPAYTRTVSRRFNLHSPWGALIAVAALLSFIVSVTAIILTYKAKTGTQVDSPPVGRTETARLTDTQSVPLVAYGRRGAGVVLAVPFARPRQRDATEKSAAPQREPETSAVNVAQKSQGSVPGLATALARGDVEPILQQIEHGGNDPLAVERVYREIGTALRSSMTAQIVLNHMSQQQQLAACRLWAADVSLRPVVFDRLRFLASSGGGSELTAQVAAIVADLDASEPTEYRKWIHSYGLASLLATRRQQEMQPASVDQQQPAERRARPSSPSIPKADTGRVPAAGTLVTADA